jgi:hypothetical protein
MQLQPTTVMEVSWSADHRVVDGATIAEVLETPTSNSNVNMTPASPSRAVLQPFQTAP